MAIANPLIVFLIGLVAVIALLVWLKLPAVIGLIIASLIVGAATAAVPFGEVPAEIAGGFGETMAGIGIPILMAAVIGKAMMESGAAERIVRSFQSVTGEDKSYLALWGSSSALSIPVFFDNVFYLMAPLARSMRARTGRDYALFLCVVGAGAATTHVFVPPTPGPLAVAAELGDAVDLGAMMLGGVLVAVPTAAISGILYGRWINNRLDDIPLRETMGSTAEEVHELAERSTSELPGMFEASLPILLAVVLVATNTTVDFMLDLAAEGVAPFAGAEGALEAFAPVASFLGDPNFALTAAALAAAVTYLRARAIEQDVWTDELVESLKSGAHIAAITSAGGAFGGLLAASGIGEYITELVAVGAGGGLTVLISAWLIAAAIRIAQGSATVAMITTAGIMAPQVPELAVHPVYLALIIGAGGNICSWFNDSGFWLVKEIGGLTQAETVKIWTALTTIISVTAFIIITITASIVPLA
ncbi:gluconate permease [Natronococcus pandeyae]|uniref:Gluconate permease n=1 Tax=Natronococcus pandeyae TaxID=2055836 RepID=A0A8J8TR79_9EURY|nr:SLC13 family permease [Natronococcus pandeyae]TYL39263.1 gluconate permease [Natronococcus pandeyae]